MTYIYDVTLNFNEVLYDFYEWNKSDNIIHVRKIPIINLEYEDYENIMNNIIKLDEDIFNNIKKKTEIYGKKNSNITAVLIKYDENIFAIKFDDMGKSIKLSSLLVEEELDILEDGTCNIVPFNYQIIKRRKQFTTTRNERKNKKYLQKKLNSLDVDKDIDKINYLYYEYFGEISNNPVSALTRLKKEINSNINDILKDFFKLPTNHK